MSAIYTELVFEPDILSSYSEDNILWKLQLSVSKDYKSLTTELIKDNIFLNNRRPCVNWINFFKENHIVFEQTFDSEYCKEFQIYDADYIFDIELFACDIKAGNYKLEIDLDTALPILYILDLKKEGIINPISLEKKIDNARQIIRANSDSFGNTEKTMLKYFLQMNKLVEHCQFYEHDIKYHFVSR